MMGALCETLGDFLVQLCHLRSLLSPWYMGLQVERRGGRWGFPNLSKGACENTGLFPREADSAELGGPGSLHF